ncbi:MAG: hypothetical protein KAI43_05070 [Candidatus Aureabacteria bacterium]|nr:hypothetical protein [Candidatus Auribacterota bacterium]
MKNSKIDESASKVFSLSESCKKILYYLFNNVIRFAISNFLWFFISLLIPSIIIITGHTKLGMVILFILLPITCSIHFIFTASIIKLNKDVYKNSYIFKVFIISLIWITLFFFFIHNTAFYFFSITSNKINLINSFFFFFSLWLTFSVFNFIIFVLPLCFKKMNILEILKAGISIYFYDVKKSILTSLFFSVITFLSFVFLFIFAMPILSLMIFFLFDSITCKNEYFEKNIKA